MYSNDAYFIGGGGGYSGYDRQERTLRRTFARFLENLERRGLTGGDLLEVGCGFGYLLSESKPYFRSVSGTDFSKVAVNHAREFVDRVYHGGLEALPVEEQFDIVVLNQVIEHVYNPVELLKAIFMRLRSGGHVVLATPDWNSPFRFVMGSRWPSYKIPEHIIYFSRRTLSLTMESAGFVNLGRLPYPHAFPFGLILEKFNLFSSEFLDRYSVWLPWTTLALYGEKRV